MQLCTNSVRAVLNHGINVQIARDLARPMENKGPVNMCRIKEYLYVTLRNQTVIDYEETFLSHLTKNSSFVAVP